MNDTFQPNTRVIHRTHPEYGFGQVRYVEEDAFGDARLQVAFDHLDNLENVDARTVQHHGSYILGLSRYFGATEIPRVLCAGDNVLRYATRIQESRR